MRTQSNVDSETRPLAATEPGADTMSFRASSLDEAVALAEESLGSPVRVVSANRIRRGGIGGFFASDLGVEVSVALDEETIEQALERLVSETADDERSRWLEHRVTAAPKSIPAPAASTSTTTMPATMPSAGTVTAPVPVTGKSALAAPRRSSLGTPKSSTIAATAPMPAKVTDASKILDALTVGDGPKIADAVARIAQRDEEPSMVRVEEIIEELSFLTRGPVLAGT
ncbi:MAG: hypothetical protein JWN99_1992, partial [Ilumatobacteraceae bacterium]|nr:hypothetical protein [Ilumatobacteraceae bacterium]